MKLRMLLLAVAVLAAGCTPRLNNNRTEDPTGPAGLEKFSSSDELLQYFRDQARNQLAPQSSGSWLDFLVGVAPPMAVGDRGAQGSELSAGNDAAGGAATSDPAHSTTNLQEQGVDEADVVKTDGNYVYVLSRGVLRIAKITPPDQMAEVASMTLAGNPDSLYLRGNQLVAVTTSGGYCCYVMDGGPVPVARTGVVAAAEGSSPPSGGAGEPGRGDGGAGDAVDPSVLPPDPWMPERAKVTVYLIDVADHAAPAIAHSFSFEGVLNTSRMIDSKLHVIVTVEPPLPTGFDSGDIDRMALADWLPDYREVAPDGTVTGDMIQWDSVYRPTTPNGYGMTGVVTLDADNPGAGFKSVAIVAAAGTVYASTEALYITDTKWSWNTLEERTTTTIHKLDLTGPDVVYVASGRVDGRLLNQFSLGEDNGYLRVATTIDLNPGFAEGGRGGVAVAVADAPVGSDGGSVSSEPGDETRVDFDPTPPPPPAEPTMVNSVFVLGVQDGELKVTGKIENIAPGEQIYSARFLGPKGFLVTFRRVDPLFTLDLSNPADPKLVGRLKVPGYSDYIHPLGENHLLTIGKDADEASGLYQGVQLSVFDVTDFANPTLLHKQIIGTRGTDSEALYNHKAFTYYEPQNLLAIPINLYEGGGTTPWDYGQYAGSGLWVYRVTVADGFDFLGKLDTGTNQYGWWWGPSFTRGIVVEDNVFAVTEGGIRGAPIADPIDGAEWRLDFPNPQPDPYPYPEEPKPL